MLRLEPFPDPRAELLALLSDAQLVWEGISTANTCDIPLETGASCGTEGNVTGRSESLTPSFRVTNQRCCSPGRDRTYCLQLQFPQLRLDRLLVLEREGIRKHLVDFLEHVVP